jgi:hypothetical protein
LGLSDLVISAFNLGLDKLDGLHARCMERDLGDVSPSDHEGQGQKIDRAIV